MTNKPNNPFNILSSKVKRVNIPIPEYNFFHKVSDEKGIDSKFIGREHISERLKAWLKDSKDYTGSYLVTGYRGMGKSSFVGKVLNEVVATPKKWVNLICYLTIILVLIACVLIIRPGDNYILGFNKWNEWIESNLLQYVIYALLFCLIIIMAYSRIGIKTYAIIKQGLFLIKVLTYSQPNQWLYRLKKGIRDWHTERIDERIENIHKDRKYNKLVIRINLGHEVLNERDILSLISKDIHDRFRKFLSDIHPHPFYLLLLLVATFFTTLGISYFFNQIWPTISEFFPKYIEKANEFVFLLQLKLGFPWIETLYVILTFIFSYLIIKHLFYRLSGIRKCLKAMQHLNDRIESTVNEDKGPNGVVATSIFGFNLDRSRKKVYAIASIREIELELIKILENVSEIPLLAPRFIIIFDELDKIDPETNYINKTEQNSIPEFKQKTSGFPGGITSRKRKQNVLRLLANMKLFVLSANSKFIFISGRELYDAFLADLSDREFAISSIFNGVIYVESFLTSDEKQRDITSMTERFISTQLIPRSYIKKEFYKRYFEKGQSSPINVCFKLYFKYLNSIYNFDKNECVDIKKIESVIILLYHFSVYLSHISNGSPKKISIYFEKYVRNRKTVNADNEDRCFTIKDMSKKSDYLLSLGYVDQRKIGFIHYIAFPVVQSIIDNASQYGDKLLISASFLVDHIYKHHNTGFSWRNIEHTPELLEIYRTPELREFIASIISFMKQTHLSPIIAGLYQLKFRKKISEEISVLSKFSEEISAIFNFTLDESLSVKKHYTALLEYYQKKGTKHDENKQELSGIHHILGDLHLMDEEYTEAIFEYQNSLHVLAKRTLNITEKDSRNDLNVLIKIRNMLKMGLAYERRNTSNSAYLIYSQLVCLLIDYRYIEEKELGLTYIQLKTKDWKNHEAVLLGEVPEQSGKKKGNFEYGIPLHEKLPETISYCAKGSELISEFAAQITPLKSSILMRLSLFEDIRLVYQALLAKLFVLEKIELGGITKENLNVLESEYNYLHLATNEKDKFIISSDFLRKLAEIMYYKNGLINKQVDRLFTGLYFWGYDIHATISDYCRMHNCTTSQKYLLKEFIDSIKFSNFQEKENDQRKPVEILKEILLKQKVLFLKATKRIDNKTKGMEKCLNDFINSSDLSLPSNEEVKIMKVQECNKHRQKLLDEKKYLPCYACKYYNRSLKLMMENYLKCDEIDHDISKAILFFNRLRNKEELVTLRSNYLSLLGHTLSGLGNVMVSCAHNKDKITNDFLEVWMKCISTRAEEFKIGKNMKRMSRLEKAILYYWDASESFELASNLQETSICHKNILTLLLNYVILQEHSIVCSSSNDDASRQLIDIIQKHLEKIKENIVSRCIRNLYSHYEYTNMAEIQKIKWLLSIQMYDKIPLQYLSLFPDIEEVLLLYNELKIRCFIHSSATKEEKAKITKNIFTNSFVSSYRIENTVYERMMVLYYKSFLHKQVLNQITQNLTMNLDYYSKYFPDQFNRFYFAYISAEQDLESILGPYYESYSSVEKTGTDDLTLKMQLLEFLINDSIFCLTKILETISPFGTSTLYTNCFIAEIYQSLMEWNLIYESIFKLYSCINKEKNEIVLIFGKKNVEGQEDLEEMNPLIEEICSILSKCTYVCTSEHPNLASAFFAQILNTIDKSNIHHTINNYLAEMAIKKYRMSKEMHSEGQAYKDMINNMYFLDDDLSNDTCQFDFAIERYKINCDYVDDNIAKLRDTFKDSSLYNIDTYSEETHSGKKYDFSDVW